MRFASGIVAAVVIGGSAIGTYLPQAPTRVEPDVVDRLEQLHRWLGGDRLDRLRVVRLEARAAEPLISVSGPGRAPVVMFRELTEIRDLGTERLRRDSRAVLPMRPEPIAFSELWSPEAAAQGTGAGWGPGSPTQWSENRLGLLYGPERVVQRALAAGDAVVGRDTVVDGARLSSIAFERGSARLLLAAGTLRGVEIRHTLPEDATWGPAGDLSTVLLFGSWSLDSSGIRFPRSIAVFRNGVVLRQLTIHHVRLGDSVPSDSLEIATELAARYRAWAPPRPGATRELAPGVALVEGPFQVVLVRQPEGVVVLGAPQSAGYSDEVIAKVGAWAPGVPVVAVVVTSGAAAHFAGVRAYAARRIPILARATLAPRLEAILAAPHRSAPDSLARLGTPPAVRTVETRTALGNGPGRLELLPNVGPGAEHDDTLVGLVPAAGLLFASDLYRPERFEPNLWTEPLAELVALARREGLSPRVVVSIHNPPTAWERAVAILRPNPSS